MPIFLTLHVHHNYFLGALRCLSQLKPVVKLWTCGFAAILQQVMYARGRELLLHPTGYLALRRMNQFSLPDAIFMGASWLFSDQASFHQGLASSGAHTTHANCAEVLKATLLRMVSQKSLYCQNHAGAGLASSHDNKFKASMMLVVVAPAKEGTHLQRFCWLAWHP